jgi:hypothetical protein
MPRRRKIQLLLWSYFWLLIFEGALRKWILPELSAPLLMIRDPFAIVAIVLALPYLVKGVWRAWVGLLWAVAILAVLFAVTVGHGDMITAVYGARILFFHLPLIFVFPLVFTRDDVWSFAKAALLTTIPMTVLIGLQYSLPQSHFLNVAPGGEGSAGFGAVLGKFRPPGTFSFINGLTHFYALTCCLCLGWLIGGPRPLPKWIWASVTGLIFALPISISRTLLFNYSLTSVFAVAASIRSGKALGNLLVYGAAIVVAVSLASQSALFQDALKAFSVRWEQANEVEGGEEGVRGVLEHRVGGNFLGGAAFAGETPILGKGIGLGTNVGATRFKGKKAFLVAENSWPATIGEMGPLLGAILLGWRVMLAFKMVNLGWKASGRINSLPLLIASAAVPNILLTPTAQPTGLGFIVLSCGLMLAACNLTKPEVLKRRAATKATKGPSPAGGLQNEVPVS